MILSFEKIKEILLGYKETIKNSLEVLRENSSPILFIPKKLDANSEIAFFSVIRHRCIKASQKNASRADIEKNISKYIDGFISNHIMSKGKEKALRARANSILNTFNYK